jgi:hypothetical protein
MQSTHEKSYKGQGQSCNFSISAGDFVNIAHRNFLGQYEDVCTAAEDDDAPETERNEATKRDGMEPAA